MINNLIGVQTRLLSKEKFEVDSTFKRPYLMVNSETSKEEIQNLINKINNLPASYLNIISNYAINGIEIDNFELSPYFSKDKNIIQNLLQAYEDPFFPKEFMRKHNMYQIGSYNTDIICVTAGTDTFKEGEILYIEEGKDIYNPQDSQIHRLAADFEQFLIIAGNLEEINSEIKEDESNYEEKKQEFFDRLKILKVPEEYHQSWEMFL